MAINVIGVVLFAALLHAGWNFLVKRSIDPYQGMSSVVLGHIPFALAAILVTPLPAAPSYPYIVFGALLHTGYQLLLLNSYRFGDLSKVYPIARGGAPLIAALVSALFLGVSFELSQVVALVVIGVSIFSLALDGIRGSSKGGRISSILAVFTSIFIAGYSLVDGMGAREAGTAVGFYGWVSILNALLFGIIAKKLRPGLVASSFSRHIWITLIGGAVSFAAYALVVWAFTVAPIALVASVRECSIIFAMLLGVFILGERLSGVKIAATILTVAGLVLLRISG